jgi:hypothetical protein
MKWAALNAIALYAAIAMLATVLGVSIANSGARGVTPFVVAILVFVVAIVVTIRLEYARNRDALCVLMVVTSYYVVAFIGGGIFVWLNPTTTGLAVFDRNDVLVALLLAGTAWMLFSVGYLADMLGGLRGWIGTPRALAPTYPVAGVVALLAAGWSARIVLLREDRYFHIAETRGARGGETWFLDAFAQLPIFCTALVLAQAMAKQGQHARLRIVAALLLLGELAWAVPTGSRTRVVAIVALVVIVRYYAAHKLPSVAGATVAAAAIVFVLFPLGAEYRATDYRASVRGALESSLATIVQSDRDDTLAGGASTVERFSETIALARLVHEGRGQISFSSADTLKLSAQGFLPRAIYPDKRDPGTFGNEFGRVYGFINSSDRSTSVAITQPGEVYLGGGWLGLLIAMPLLGALYRVLNDLLARRRDDPGLLAIYAFILPTFAFGLETSIAIGLVGPIKLAIVVVIVAGGTFHLLGLRRSRSERAY